jgi:hypothetical protein
VVVKKLQLRAALFWEVLTHYWVPDLPEDSIALFFKGLEDFPDL